MQKRRFGPRGNLVPCLGLGTWHYEQGNREDAIQSVRRAVSLGMTHIDTAELYGNGAVEEIVGEALVGHRADVFLASKIRPELATYAGTLLACEKSLRRLRTDRLDLYLLHWPGPQPLEETFRAFEALRAEGKILAWGVSNFDVADLERAIEVAGEGVIACNQVLYHLEERDAEHVLQSFCERRHIAFVGYSPLGSGRFPKPGSWGGDVLAGIAELHGVSAHAVALAFLARHPNTFLVPKSARLEHVDALARAGDLTLHPEELERIAQAFELEPPKSVLPTL